MSGGNRADPWGVVEEPEEYQGIGNMDLRSQQQHAIRGKHNWNNNGSDILTNLYYYTPLLGGII